MPLQRHLRALKAYDALLGVGAVAVVAGVYFLLGRYPAFLAATALVGIFVGSLLFARRSTAREGVQGLSAALSSIALLLAAYWYFIDRRGYPKLNLEPQLEAWPVADGALMVWVSLKLTNVGNLALKFDGQDDSKLLVQVGQIVPLTGRQASGLLQEMQAGAATGNKDFRLVRTDNWSARATFEEPIESTIEAGETENLYFKAVIPCADDMVLAVTATVPKDLKLVGNRLGSQERHSWIAQSVFPTGAKCTATSQQGGQRP